MDQKVICKLIKDAFLARKAAYAPYSRYMVGAALLAGEDRIYKGCNIENASYGATNCAERTAFFQAVSLGERDFRAIAIVGGNEGEAKDGAFEGLSDYAYPCGICRQVMQEFCNSDFQIIVAKSLEDYKIISLEELLPYGFGGDKL